MKFENKIAIITGAASGIGLGVAKFCLKQKMKIFLADIDERALFESGKELKEMIME
ncbi:MAG: SDR family NAD(P)-dependent oxidoreductase [Promethearchaeota archaeon]